MFSGHLFFPAVWYGILEIQPWKTARLMDPESFKGRSCNLYLEMAGQPFLCFRVLGFDLSISSGVCGVSG